MPANVIGLHERAADPYSHVKPSDAEILSARSLLGACLLNGAFAWPYAETLQTNYFPPEWRPVFDAIRTVAENDGPTKIDLCTVLQAIRNDGTNEAAIPAHTVSSLTEATPTSANADVYARQVSDAARRRLAVQEAHAAGLHLKQGDPLDTLTPHLERLSGLVSDDGAALFSFQNIAEWIEDDAPAMDYVFQDVIPRGIVGIVSGAGGLGKSYTLLTLAMAAATGRELIPGFNPGQQLKALTIFGEDPAHCIWKRFRAIRDAHELTADQDSDLLHSNLQVCAGQAAPLLALDAHGNISTTPALSSLAKLLKQHRPDLVVIDPLVRFYGASENANEHADRFISELQRLAVEHECAILLIHHTGKSGQAGRSTGQDHARGASAFTSAARWAANVLPLSEEEARRFECGPDDAWRYLQLRQTKSNHAPGLRGRPCYLKLNDDGVPMPVDLQGEREATICHLIYRYLCANPEDLLSERDLRRGDAGEGLRAFLTKQLSQTPAAREIWAALQFGFDNLAFRIEEAARDGAGRPKRAVRPVPSFERDLA